VAEDMENPLATDELNKLLEKASKYALEYQDDICLEFFESQGLIKAIDGDNKENYTILEEIIKKIGVIFKKRHKDTYNTQNEFETDLEKYKAKKQVFNPDYSVIRK